MVNVAKVIKVLNYSTFYLERPNFANVLKSQIFQNNLSSTLQNSTKLF